MRVIKDVLGSFKLGLPLGNLTSQLFGNIYMNEFDRYVLKLLRVGLYVRYADDFVIISRNKDWLRELIPKIDDFLKERLNLELHRDKISVKTITSGVDFLGWVNFQDHRVLRTKTKRRMMAKLNKASKSSVASYLGLLKHGNAHKLSDVVKEKFMLS
jgi:hypothetical protein